jgi:hypothetical protein
MMSSKLSAGSCLEGTPAVPVDVSLQPVLLDRLGQQIHLATDQLGQAPLQRPEREKPDAGLGVQFGGKVNVAVSLGIAARDGTEKRQASDASLA